ncbi:MAG: glycosyltransferase [Mediterranea sp.]|jgi:hypothetical protein|nr:glycosyltransferase [Mediterranea sp.]
MTPAPILLFVYNRPEHTRRLVESLQQNPPAAGSRLIIYSDAAKYAEERPAVIEVRKYIRTIAGFASVAVIEQTENKGLAQSIITGVGKTLEEHDRVIVLEDDLVVAPHFLRFMNDALETYKDEPRVGHIHACDFTQDPSLPDTFLIKWIGSWGWATWKRAWQHFNPDGKALLAQLRERKLTHAFDFNGSYGFTRMLRRQIAGKNNSWAIRWNASLFLENILSLNAGKSLVRNEGFDGSGTHCGNDDGLYTSRLWIQPLPVEKISPVEENSAARDIYCDYYRCTNSFKAKVLRRIKKELRKIGVN